MIPNTVEAYLRQHGIRYEHLVHGRAVTAQRLRLDRTSWQAHRSLPVETSGLEPCLPWFGLAP